MSHLGLVTMEADKREFKNIFKMEEKSRIVN